MKCLRCNANWIVNNISPKFDKCPVCEISFEHNREYIKFEDVAELLLYLFKMQGIAVCDNTQMIQGYVSDLFPGDTVLANRLKELLDKGAGKCVKAYFEGNKKAVSNFLQSLHGEDDYDNIEKVLLFITGIKEQKGTNLESSDYYYVIHKHLNDEKYKRMAMLKAVRHLSNASTETKAAIAKAYEKGILVDSDLNESIRITRELSSEGNSDYLFQLARCLIKRNEAGDLQEAELILKKAADAGHIKASYYYYRMVYESGKNTAGLRQYLIKAAHGNYIPAVYDYAIMLLKGDEIEQDVDSALNMLRYCSDHDYKLAHSKLRYLYMTGTFVEQDIIAAMMYSGSKEL